jgi:hypothetical protein
VRPPPAPHDGGAITSAEGTPIRKGSRIVAYTVASGDIYDSIVERFHLRSDGHILRRGEAAQRSAGDVLNLSACTLDKYGSATGRAVKDRSR